MRPRIVKYIETENRTVVTRGWGRGDGELGFSVWDDEKVLEVDGGMAAR